MKNKSLSKHGIGIPFHPNASPSFFILDLLRPRGADLVGVRVTGRCTFSPLWLYSVLVQKRAISGPLVPNLYRGEDNCVAFSERPQLGGARRHSNPKLANQVLKNLIPRCGY